MPIVPALSGIPFLQFGREIRRCTVQLSELAADHFGAIAPPSMRQRLETEVFVDRVDCDMDRHRAHTVQKITECGPAVLVIVEARARCQPMAAPNLSCDIVV